jgi:hypothetical protein
VDKADRVNRRHRSSAVINQPLWQAASRYGADAILALCLRSLRHWSGPLTYLNLAQRVVAAACDTDAALSQHLEAEYRVRGLAVAPSTCAP